MEWVRGEMIGRGSFGTINLATPRRHSSQIPTLMAVKSALFSRSSMLRKEKQILSHLSECSQILQCFGDDVTVENGEKVYNVFLELACRGNLSQLVQKSGGAMNAIDVRHSTKSILQGLCYIHAKGYVHCDIKPQNILVCGETDVKIADFGLAKKAGKKKNAVDEELGLIGTPLYMSPEAISRNELEAPSDVWALGCIVVEMVTGKPAWKYQDGTDVSSLLFRVGFGDEMPHIPDELSEEGKDFLSRCFVRDPTKRWTAEMLLNHPFMDEDTVRLTYLDIQSPSPRSVFDFPEWSLEKLSITSSCSSDRQIHCFDSSFSNLSLSFGSDDRIPKLALGNKANWSFSDDWITVRGTKSLDPG